MAKKVCRFDLYLLSIFVSITFEKIFLLNSCRLSLLTFRRHKFSIKILICQYVCLCNISGFCSHDLFLFVEYIFKGRKQSVTAD